MHSFELSAKALQIRLMAALINKLAMRDVERRLDATGAGVSGLQHAVMQMVGHQSSTISEMSARMSLSPATLVPVVDALERKGLVRRGSDPRDRRRTPLSLTADGVERLSCLPLVDRADSLVAGLEAMGDEKITALWELLCELANAMTGDEATIQRILASTRASAEEGLEMQS